jgi:hypothetical protein
MITGHPQVCDSSLILWKLLQTANCRDMSLEQIKEWFKDNQKESKIIELMTPHLHISGSLRRNPAFPGLSHSSQAGDHTSPPALPGWTKPPTPNSPCTG